MLAVGVFLCIVGGILLLSWLVPVLRAGDCRGAVRVVPSGSALVQSAHRARQLMRDEVWIWAALAGPVLCANVLNQSMVLTDISVLGHLASDQHFPNATAVDFLAAASLAYSWVYSLTILIFAGFTSAISVLSSQALGAKNEPRAVQVLVVGVGASLLACIPIGIGQYYSSSVIATLLPKTHSSRRHALIQKFSRVLLLSLPGQTLASALTNFLQTLQVVRVPLLISLAAALGNVGINLVLVHGTGAGGWPGLGFVGSPLATTLTTWMRAIALITYALCGAGTEQHQRCQSILKDKLFRRNGAEASARETQPLLAPADPVVETTGARSKIRQPDWHRNRAGGVRLWSSALVKEFVLEQALPLALGGAFEEWQVQVITFFAGSLGAAAVATHNGLLNVFLTISSINYGIMSATTVRVGFRLGEGNPERAYAVSLVALVASVACGGFIGAGFILGRFEIGRIFSSDPEVLQLTSQLCWLVGPCYILLSVFFVSIATLEGQGRAMALAVSFLVGGWGVSVPVSWILSKLPAGLDIVHHQALVGVWLGLVAGYTVITLLAGWSVLKSDWGWLAEKARQAAMTPQ